MKNLFLAIIISSYSYNFLQAAQAEDTFTTPKRKLKSPQPVIIVTPAQDTVHVDQSAERSLVLDVKLDHDEFDYASDTSCSSQKSTSSRDSFKDLIDEHVQTPIQFSAQSSRVSKAIALAKKRSRKEENTIQDESLTPQDYYDEFLKIIRTKNDISTSSTTSLSLFVDYLRTIKQSTIPTNSDGQNPAHFVYNKPQYQAFLPIITRFRPAWLSQKDYCGKLPEDYKFVPKKTYLKQKRKKRK